MNGYLAVIGKLRLGTAGNLVGGSGTTTARIFPGDFPQGEVYPMITVDTYDDDVFDTKSGVATTEHELVKVFCYGTSDNETRALAAAVRTDLDEQSGTMNGFTVENIRFLRFDTYDLNLTNRRSRVHEQDYEVRIRN